jgi:hypothetical protein
MIDFGGNVYSSTTTEIEIRKKSDFEKLSLMNEFFTIVSNDKQILKLTNLTLLELL